MTYRANGTLLSDLFEARSGAPTATVGYSEQGVNFNQIYQQLEHDSRIPDIGYSHLGTDLAQIFKGNLLQFMETRRAETSRATYWNGILTCSFRVTFASVAARTDFFTFGGRIVIDSVRRDGSVNLKNATWTNLLNAAGNIEIAKRFTLQNAQTVVSTIGVDNLTTTYQLLYTGAGASPYTQALYRIYAKLTPVTASVDILVTFDDATLEIADENINGILETFIRERRHPSQPAASYVVLSGLDTEN